MIQEAFFRTRPTLLTVRLFDTLPRFTDERTDFERVDVFRAVFFTTGLAFFTTGLAFFTTGLAFFATEVFLFTERDLTRDNREVTLLTPDLVGVLLFVADVFRTTDFLAVLLTDVGLFVPADLLLTTADFLTVLTRTDGLFTLLNTPAISCPPIFTHPIEEPFHSEEKKKTLVHTVFQI